MWSKRDLKNGTWQVGIGDAEFLVVLVGRGVSETGRITGKNWLCGVSRGLGNRTALIDTETVWVNFFIHP